MPWLGANGLLPGRGAPARGAGRGPGVGGLGARGAAGAADAAGASGVWAAGAAGSSTGAGVSAGAGAAFLAGPGLGAEGAAGAASAGADAAAAGAASVCAGVGDSLAGALASAGASGVFLASRSAPYVASNFFTAGSSTLDDAVLANSPIAPSFSSASLLVMPYCFASSDTRVLATILLLATDPVVRAFLCDR